MNGHARSDSASDEPEAPCQTTGDINITLASMTMEKRRAQSRESTRKYNAANPEKKKESRQKWYAKNREYHLERQRKYREKKRAPRVDNHDRMDMLTD